MGGEGEGREGRVEREEGRGGERGGEERVHWFQRSTFDVCWFSFQSLDHTKAFPG